MLGAPCRIGVLGLLVIPMSDAHAQPHRDRTPDGPATPDALVAHHAKLTVTKTVDMSYLLYLPDGYKDDRSRRWPLVVFLHGAGERGDDLNKVKLHGPPRYIAKGTSYPFILLAPQCPEKRWWDADVILALLDRVAAAYRVDPDRVYLTGLSMGGFGTWEAAATAPRRFAAIVPICGGGDPATAPKLVHTPIWAFHGADDPVVPVARSRRMVDAVQAAGGDAKLTVYPDTGHDSWTRTYEDPRVFDWLLAHKRSTDR